MNNSASLVSGDDTNIQHPRSQPVSRFLIGQYTLVLQLKSIGAKCAENSNCRNPNDTVFSSVDGLDFSSIRYAIPREVTSLYGSAPYNWKHAPWTAIR